MTDGPKTKMTPEEVAKEVEKDDRGNSRRIVNGRGKVFIPIAHRKNRDLSKFGTLGDGRVDYSR